MENNLFVDTNVLTLLLDGKNTVLNLKILRVVPSLNTNNKLKQLLNFVLQKNCTILNYGKRLT